MGLKRNPNSAIMLGNSFIIGNGYDGERLRATLKLYEPLSQKIYVYSDQTNHHPYCILRTEPLTTEAAVENAFAKTADENGDTKIVEWDAKQMYDAIQDRATNVVVLYTQSPTDVAGAPGCIREKLDVNQADIRYSDCYTNDTRLEPGMPYTLKDGMLKPAIPELEKLPEQLQKAVNETVTERMLKRFFRLFESPVPNYRRVAVDIEVAQISDIRPADPAEAEMQITACSMMSSDGVKKVLMLRRHPFDSTEQIALDRLRDQFTTELFDDEPSLIAAIFKVLWDYPVVLTFNGDEYDFRMLYTRAQRFGFATWDIPIEYHRSWMGLKYGIHIDLMRMFANRSLCTYAFGSKYKLSGPTVGLDDVATGMLGEGKYKHEHSIHEMGYVELATYGFKDAELTFRLTSYGNDTVMRLLTILSRISYQAIEDVCRGGASTWIKNLMYREHRVRNIIIPRAIRDETNPNPDLRGVVIGGDILSVPDKARIDTKPDIEGKKFRGAMVVDPNLGLHFNVSVLDFASLYPSIIQTWNLGYETICCPHKDCKENNPRIVPFTTHWMCKKHIAMTAEIIGTLKDIRVHWYKPKGKDKNLDPLIKEFYAVIEQTLKVFMNATYGVFSSDKFPLYCPAMGEAVTQVGRYSIGQVIELAIKLGALVFYGDTDSIFIDVSPEVLKQLIDFALTELHMVLELDKSYRWLALSGRKKNYIGVLVDKKGNPEIIIKGMTGKKRHTPKFIKEMFNSMMEILKQMASPADVPKINDAIVQLIRENLKKLRAGGFPIKDMAFTVGLQRDPKSYIKAKPMHVKVALQMEGAKAGDTISFVKTLGEATAKHVSVAKPEEINVKAYEEFVESTLEQVLDCIGIKWEVIDVHPTQQSLFGEPAQMNPKTLKPKKVAKKK